MPVRMTGMISGLDTDYLIQTMIEAQRMKNKRVEDKSTLLTWKQDRWKELNTKLYKLYTDDLNKMRLQGSYLTKSVTTSNDAFADVKGLTNAPIGTHKLEIGSLASSQYVTGGVVYLKDDKGVNLKDDNGNYIKASANTKLKDLGIATETLINVTVNGEEKTFEVKAGSTLNDFVNFAKGAGLSANYDANHGRLYLSAKNSGVENAFGITATASIATKPKNELQEMVGYTYLSTTDKAEVDKAIKTLQTSAAGSTESEAAIDILEDYARKEAERKIYLDVDAAIKGEVEPVAEEAEKNNIRAEVTAQEIILLQEEARKKGKTQEEIDAITEESLDQKQLEEKQDAKIAASQTRITAVVNKAVAEAIAAEKELENNRYDVAIAENQSVIDEAMASAVDKAEEYQTNYHQSLIDGDEDKNSQLNLLGLDALDETGAVIGGTNNSKVVAAADSSITYNDVVYTGSTNVFNVNGLEISLKKVTEGETVNLNVSSNTQAVYDMVKKFVTSYNDILKEMNDLYYAPSSRGYDPLSDDEKDQMSEKEIDRWEDKIKDSILRNDTTLGSLLSSMKTAMMTSVEVDGVRYSLSSYGIQTSANYKENGLLHIFGDEDDAEYGDRTDKLLAALGEDPDKVMEVLSKISQNLYDTMYDKMKAIPNVRSAFTFYNDKTMSKQQTDYAKKIAQLEAKLIATEEKYYKQFAAMETALAKLQSQSNALASMLGMSNQK